MCIKYLDIEVGRKNSEILINLSTIYVRGKGLANMEQISIADGQFQEFKDNTKICFIWYKIFVFLWGVEDKKSLVSHYLRSE